MILKYTWHGANVEARHLAMTTGRRYRVRKIVPPGALLHWWVIEPVPAPPPSAGRRFAQEVRKALNLMERYA